MELLKIFTTAGHAVDVLLLALLAALSATVGFSRGIKFGRMLQRQEEDDRMLRLRRIMRASSPVVALLLGSVMR